MGPPYCIYIVVKSVCENLICTERNRVDDNSQNEI